MSFIQRSLEDVIPISRQNAGIPKHASLYTFICRPERFCCILHNQRIMRIGDRFDFIHLSGCTVQISNHDEPHIRINLERLLQRHRIHIPGVTLRIDEHRNTAFVVDPIHGCAERHVRTEHTLSFKRSMFNLRLNIEFFATKLDSKMKCCSTG